MSYGIKKSTLEDMVRRDLINKNFWKNKKFLSQVIQDLREYGLL